MTFRFLTEQDVRQVLPASELPALVALMKDALADFSAGRVTQPVRSAVPVGPPGQYLGLMPALVPASGALGAKLVSVVPGNAARGLSTHYAVVALFDTGTGALTALVDGRYITEVRTAAVSTVSIQLLARPDASRLGILGAGVQARSHLEAIAATRRLTCVRAWGPDAAQLREFASEMSRKAGVEVVASRNAEDAVTAADLIVLATASPDPVIRSEWVADGAHVVSVGACRPDQREMDGALIARARLVVDSRDAALVESGDIVQGMAEGRFGRDHLAGELGEIALGRVPGRLDRASITLFKSLGLAVEDVVTAAWVVRRAGLMGIGRDLSL
jgi:alanine dehydrogenase